MNRSIFKTSASVILAGLLSGSPAGAKVMDRTLATVNEDAILLSEFDKNATPILEQFKKAAPPAEQTPERVQDIKKRVLDQMVDDRLLAQEAKKKNIKISQIEVDDGVKKVRTRFQTEAEFNEELKGQGMTFPEFREHIQKQLATIKLIDAEVKAKITPPTDKEIQDLYEKIEAVSKNKPLPSGMTATEVDELKALARAVQGRFGERARARHILLRVAPTASASEKDAVLKKMKDIQAQLKKGEDFAALAKKYSEDPGSKERGGDLGYFGRGEMVPPFDKAAFSLAVGDTSDIVATDFGYHIIRVEERKAASKMSLDEVKDDLAEYLYQQKGAKKFEQFVKDLRAKANIKINSFN